MCALYHPLNGLPTSHPARIAFSSARRLWLPSAPPSNERQRAQACQHQGVGLWLRNRCDREAPDLEGVDGTRENHARDQAAADRHELN